MTVEPDVAFALVYTVMSRANPSVLVEEKTWVERVLGRPERDIPIDEPLALLAGKRILITGAAGSIGRALAEQLAAHDVVATDLDSLDVRKRQVGYWYGIARGSRVGPGPEIIFHLAGAKHAPEGETDPWKITETNVVGTRNLLSAFGVRVVLASTCKAADPETAYGASKLIAERMVLNAGGAVARFYNVVETGGNVFDTWADMVAERPLPVTPCSRFFISLREAVALLLWAAVLPSGRYTVDPGKERPMVSVANDLYPGCPITDMPPRRGDRVREPLHATNETVEHGNGPIMRIRGPHDPEPAWS